MSSASAVAAMPAATFRPSARLMAPFASGLLTFAILAVASWSFVGSGFLVDDDTIYLGRATAGQPLPADDYLSIGIFNVVGESTGSIVVTKLVPMVFLAIAAAIAAAMLFRVLRRPVLAIVLGAAVMLVPVSPAVGPWTTGAHPEMAAPLVMAGMWVAWGSWVRKERFDVLAAAAATILFAVASLMSPTAMLVMLLYPLWAIGVALVARTRRRGFLPALAVSAVLTAIGLYRALDYHYTALVGWVDRSPARAFTNLHKAFDFVVGAPTGTLARVVMIGGLVVLAFAAIGTYRRAAGAAIIREPARASLVWFGLAGAGLALLPGFAVVGYRPRYVSLGVMLAAFALAAALPPARAVTAARRGPYLVAGAALVLVGFTLAAGPMRASTYGLRAEQHEILSTALSREAGRWSPDAQVVVALEEAPGPSSGFNHWSTWYLRNVTDRADVTGLIGWVGYLDPSPFVSTYADHAPEYWAIINGVSRRLRMRGLEMDRPTYAYELAATGQFTPVPICFISGDQAWLLPAGVAPGHAAQGAGADCRSQPGAVMDWTLEKGLLTG